MRILDRPPVESREAVWRIGRSENRASRRTAQQIVRDVVEEQPIASSPVVTVNDSHINFGALARNSGQGDVEVISSEARTTP